MLLKMDRESMETEFNIDVMHQGGKVDKIFNNYFMTCGVNVFDKPKQYPQNMIKLQFNPIII
jgi:hypothetical protein